MQIYLHIFLLFFFAEGEGFEPSERYKRSTVFKTAAIDHSANPPYINIYKNYTKVNI